MSVRSFIAEIGKDDLLRQYPTDIDYYHAIIPLFLSKRTLLLHY